MIMPRSRFWPYVADRYRFRANVTQCDINNSRSLIYWNRTWPFWNGNGNGWQLKDIFVSVFFSINWQKILLSNGVFWISGTKILKSGLLSCFIPEDYVYSAFVFIFIGPLSRILCAKSYLFSSRKWWFPSLDN